MACDRVLPGGAERVLGRAGRRLGSQRPGAEFQHIHSLGSGHLVLSLFIGETSPVVSALQDSSECEMRSYLGLAASFILQTHPTFIVPTIQKRIERRRKNKIPTKAAVPNLFGIRDRFP